MRNNINLSSWMTKGFSDGPQPKAQNISRPRKNKTAKPASASTMQAAMAKEFAKKYGTPQCDARRYINLAKKELGSPIDKTVLMAAAANVMQNERGSKNNAQASAKCSPTSPEKPTQLDTSIDESLLIEFNDPNVLTFSISQPRDQVPGALSEKGVTLQEWTHIWDSLAQLWAPQLQKSYEIDVHVVRNLKLYQSETYWNEAAWGEWGDNGVEKKVSKQLLTSSHALSSATMMASNTLAMANFLLNRKGIVVQLHTQNIQYFQQADSLFGNKQYFKEADFLKPDGLLFIVMKDEETNQNSKVSC